MKLSLDTASGHVIQGYQPGEIRVLQLGSVTDEHRITSSAIITPEQIIEDWLETDQPLSPEHIQKILALKPEVILLGTGEQLVFPTAAILQDCYHAGVGVEVMDTGAACRTYNILAAEGRQVAMGIMQL